MYNTSMQVEVLNKINEEIKYVRTQVFMLEQGFKDEFDDLDEISNFILIKDSDKPVGTCRIYVENNKYILGRLCVVKDYRKQHLGKQLLDAAQSLVLTKGGHSIHLHAQVRAAAFYQNNGYQSYGNVDQDEGVDHIWMKKTF